VILHLVNKRGGVSIIFFIVIVVIFVVLFLFLFLFLFFLWLLSKQNIGGHGRIISKRPKRAVLTGMVFGQVSIKKSSGHIRRYEDRSQGALISSV